MAAVASAQPTTARTARTSPLSLAANITTPFGMPVTGHYVIRHLE